MRAAVLGLLLLAAPASGQPAADLGPGDCAPLTLTDAASGRAVVGIEDLAADAARGVVYLSAHDRFALEDALAANAASLPAGGLYALDAALLARGAGHLVLPRQGRLELRPHGIALGPSPWGPALYAVNRRYERQDGAWQPAVSIEVFARTGAGLAHRRSLAHPALCRANDVAVSAEGRVFVSLDHGACGGPLLWLENIFGLARASVVELRASADEALELVPVIEGLGYANGLAIAGAPPALYVAATRERALQVYAVAALGQAAPAARRIALAGGPDNITLAGDDRLLVAVHPSLWRFALHRYRWLGGARAPARVLAVERAGGGAAPLYDDPQGALAPGITAAAILGERLLLGSATAAGLLACPLA